MTKNQEFRLDDEEFLEALELYQEATGKATVEIVNRKAYGVCFEAAKAIKKAKKGDITMHSPAKKKGKPKEKKLFHALASMSKAKGGKVGTPRGKGNQAAAKKIYDKRLGAITYAKVIFWSLKEQFFDGGGEGKFKKKTAKGTKATTAQPIPTATIDTGGVEREFRDGLLSEAFAKGVKAEARQTRRYAESELAKIAKKYSGR